MKIVISRGKWFWLSHRKAESSRQLVNTHCTALHCARMKLLQRISSASILTMPVQQKWNADSVYHSLTRYDTVGGGEARPHQHACHPRPPYHHCRQQTTRRHRLWRPIRICQIRPSSFRRYPRRRISPTRKLNLTGRLPFNKPSVQFKHFHQYAHVLATCTSLNWLLIHCFQLLFIGAIEYGFGRVQKTIEEDCNNYMDGLGWSADKQQTKAAVELNNGRAAQMGILALMVHEKLNNDPYIINSLLGAPVPFNQ